MNEIVKIVLSLSVSGSILVVLIFAIKQVIKHKLSKSIQYYLWIIILLRLTIPFSFETSIMNKLFFGNQTPVVSTFQGVGQPFGSEDKSTLKSYKLYNDQENITNSVFNSDSKQGKYFQDLFNKYALYLWILGVMISLTLNLAGYAKFLKYLKLSNIPATNYENEMLITLLNGRYNVRLSRNKFLNTPMLIGILRPHIIIPDIKFNETQLKNILLHEIVHLKRFDIAVKWLTMLASAIHWFNPLMYLMKKEINNSCELACDEEVIKNLSPSEKQDYGDTLISVVALYKYPIGILQVTMCEEKRGLKERLVAIMNHTKKSKLITMFSMILLGLCIFGAIYLGAGIGKVKVSPMFKYNLNDISNYKTPYVGDNNKVSTIISKLPVPDSYFKQKYISMVTDKKPYKLNVFYEANEVVSHSSKWPIINHDNLTYSNMSKNALILFYMIGNLQEVTFAFSDSQTDGKLDVLKYNYTYKFIRNSFEKRYGNLSVIGGKLDLLQDALKED